MVIAYLIYTHNMSYDSAFDLVKRKRACIKPNSGFVRALQDWERQWRLAPQRPAIRRAGPQTDRRRGSHPYFSLAGGADF